MDYSEKSVLVSGGTGSFGNFIVRRLLDLGAREVRVLSRDEKKQHDMRVFYRGRNNLSFVIGDVLRSRGSVIPLFRRLLATGKRLTITDERMTRFLLTLNDAIDLVLYAAEQQQGGEIFVRKAPAALITDLAAIISEEAGKPLEYDIIGMLPGEKLNEIMLTEEELIRTEDLGDYYKIHPWWSKGNFDHLQTEYSSFDSLVEKDAIKRLMARADREFEEMEMAGGEFANF